VVTHQLRVERIMAKERWPETDVLLLSHAEQFLLFIFVISPSCISVSTYLVPCNK